MSGDIVFYGLATVVIFVLAGLVKGVTGMGLPTVAIGLLGLFMAPAEAAALLVIPSLATNLWQFAAGPHRLATLRRLWPMLLAVAVATWAASGLITVTGSGARAALGVALILYALIGLAKVQLSVPRRLEPVLAPVVGAATGLVTGATGVFVLPAVPYLQALGLDRDDLVQALGLSFTASTLALAAGLATQGAFHPSAAGLSLLCTAPALLGTGLGQSLRRRIDPVRFRLVFFIGLGVLGFDLAWRAG
jgi:uncharacterized membrane protein YfcA